MNSKSLMNVATVLAVVSAVVAACRFDWILVGVEVIFLILLYYPYRKSQLAYGRSLVLVGAIFSAILLVVSIIFLSGALSDWKFYGHSCMFIVEQLLKPGLTFTIGFMFALLLDRYTESVFSKRWLIVFAIGFAFAVSAMDVFTVGFNLWATGQEFFYHGRNVDHFTDHELMLAPDFAVISVIISAIVCRRLTKGMSKESFLTEVSA